MFGVHSNDCVISDQCYQRTILQRNYRKESSSTEMVCSLFMFIYSMNRNDSYNSFVFHFTRIYTEQRERSGSVLECLTRDQGAVGSSLTGVTVLCP